MYEHRLILNIRPQTDISALASSFQQPRGNWFYFEVCLRLENSEVDLLKVFSIPAIMRDGKSVQEVQELFKYKVMFDNLSGRGVRFSPFTTDQIIEQIQKLAIDGKTKKIPIDKLVQTLLLSFNRPENSGRSLNEFSIKMAVSQGILKGKLASLSSEEVLIIPSQQ